MKEKELTDEELVKALEFCINNLCSLKCPIHNDTSCVQTLKIRTLGIIHRQKAEIERLTEENKQLEEEIDLEVDLQTQRKRQIIAESQEFIDELANKNAELQKQVNELKERAKIDLENERNWGKIQTKQAVKDTAKEIGIVVIQLSNMCPSVYEFQNRLVDLIETNYGVEIVRETIIPTKGVEVE